MGDELTSEVLVNSERLFLLTAFLTKHLPALNSWHPDGFNGRYCIYVDNPQEHDRKKVRDWNDRACKGDGGNEERKRTP